MRADRLLRMIWMLSGRAHPTPASELADRLEVSVRTVLRDVEALSAAGVPVYTRQGRCGGVSLLPHWRPDLLGLGADEARALTAAASLAGAAALEKVDIGGSTVSHAEVLASLPKLKTLRMSKTKGVASILPFGAAPSLTSLTVKEGAFPPQEIAAVNAARQAKYPSFKVNEY